MQKVQVLNFTKIKFIIITIFPLGQPTATPKFFAHQTTHPNRTFPYFHLYTNFLALQIHLFFKTDS